LRRSRQVKLTMAPRRCFHCGVILQGALVWGLWWWLLTFPLPRGNHPSLDRFRPKFRIGPFPFGSPMFFLTTSSRPRLPRRGLFFRSFMTGTLRALGCFSSSRRWRPSENAHVDPAKISCLPRTDDLASACSQLACPRFASFPLLFIPRIFSVSHNCAIAASCSHVLLHIFLSTHHISKTTTRLSWPLRY